MKKKKLIKNFINSFLKIFNLRLNKITLSNNFYYHIAQTLEFHNIDLVLDIGANEGQFAEKLIEHGYKKKIISFEPIENVHKILKNNSKAHDNWIVYENLGFGKINETKLINISKNSVSSSILEINKTHLDIEPDARTIRKEEIRLITLNDFLSQNEYKDKKIFVKIDTQGYEENILLGADKVLNQISTIMIETSISKVYDQEKDYLEMINLMKSFGFHVWSVERGFTNKKTGQVLQLDIIFVNNDAN